MSAGRIPWPHAVGGAAVVVAVFGAGACQPAESSLGAASLSVDDSTTRSDSGNDTTAAVESSGDDPQRLDLPPSGEDGLKLDVAAAFDVGSACAVPPCSCGAVDILFVVDNSTGMTGHHEALAQTLPSFVEALAPAVDSATSLHVGVTSTTMGVSQTRVSDDCTATGDRGAPAASFYETAERADNGLQAAQGRLHLSAGMPFYALGPERGESVEALTTWFADAVALPEGSQIEMAGATAAWATDPVNDAVNAGFVRPDAALLIVFVLGEPDQTPTAEASDLVARLEASKPDCGGLDCVVAAALLPPDCQDEGGLVTMLNALPAAQIEVLPEAAALATSGGALGASLAPVLRQACR